MKIKRNFISHQKSKSINNHKLSAKEFDTNNNQLNGLPKNNFIYDNNKNGKNLINEDIKNKYEINNISNNNNSEEKIDNNNFTKTIDEMNQNVLNLYYDKNSLFKQKIDDLNLKFYLETEKYLKNSKINDQTLNQKLQANLFIILFQQINTLLEEIERLNKIILDNKYKKENILQRTNDLYEKKKNILLKDNLIQSLKKSNTKTEKKLLEALLHEDKLIKDNERLRKENETYRTLSIVFENELKNDHTPQKNKIVRHLKTYSDYGVPSISIINELCGNNTSGTYEEKYGTLDNGKKSTVREDKQYLYNSKYANKDLDKANNNKKNLNINQSLNQNCKNKENNKNIKCKIFSNNPILTEVNTNKEKKNAIKYLTKNNKQKQKKSQDKKFNNTNKKNNDNISNKNTLNSYKIKKLNIIKKLNNGINLDSISNNINSPVNINKNAITDTNNLSSEKVKETNFQKIENKKVGYHKKQKTMSEISFNEIVKVHILNDEFNNSINNKGRNNKVQIKKNNEINNLKKNPQYKTNYNNKIKKNF